MKIMRIIALGSKPDVDFHPDSALLLPGRPMFYPDFGGEWVAYPYVAVHINRLGKGVSVKFAHRYYDACAMAVRILPAEDGCEPEGLLSGVDNSITHGAWIEPETFVSFGPVSLSGKTMDVSTVSLDSISAAVKSLSAHTTLRMGDIILMPIGSRPVGIVSRSYLRAVTSEGREILNVKVV